MVRLGRLCRETGFNVAQTFPVAQLCKRQAAKMFGTRKCANAAIASIAIDDSRECCPRLEVTILLTIRNIPDRHMPLFNNTGRIILSKSLEREYKNDKQVGDCNESYFL